MVTHTRDSPLLYSKIYNWNFQKQCKESQEGLEAQLEISIGQKMLEFEEALKTAMSEVKQLQPEHAIDVFLQ